MTVKCGKVELSTVLIETLELISHANVRSLGDHLPSLHSLMYPDLVECADLVMNLYANLVKRFIFKEWIVDSSRIPAQLNPRVEGLVRMFMNLHRVKIWQPSVEDLINQGFLSSLSGVK
ncbi:hypothetical protein G9A89_003894 [Geosiphon pyriformis]|nr:hypothetical protein G9A89_003894 [Geosiphon pyriformis]